MNTTNQKKKPAKYARKVCGGIRNVKRILTAELKSKRIEAGLSPEQIDEIIDVDSGFPKIREIEENPDLFSGAFLQHWNILRLDNFDAYEKLFDITGEGLDYFIDKFLANSRNLDKAVQDFKDSCVSVHAELIHEDMDEYVTRVFEGKPVKTFAPNMISPYEYASIHIYGCIMGELSEYDEDNSPVTTELMFGIMSLSIFGASTYFNNVYLFVISAILALINVVMCLFKYQR